jgi:sugar-phosphatase
MTYAAILFDMDGVIIDTRPSVNTFWQRLAAENGIELTTADFHRDIYGCPMLHTLQIFFPQLDPQAVSHRLDIYELNLTYTEIPGATTLLQACRQAGLPTALVTSANRRKVSVVMSQLGLKDVFTSQVTVEEIRRGKPHPDCYTLAAQRLDLLPEQCLVFEDAVSGIKAGVAAGAHCIGVQPPDGAAALIQAGAQWVVPDLRAVSLQLAGNGHRPTPHLQLGPTVSLPLARRNLDMIGPKISS